MTRHDRNDNPFVYRPSYSRSRVGLLDGSQQLGPFAVFFWGIVAPIIVGSVLFTVGCGVIFAGTVDGGWGAMALMIHAQTIFGVPMVASSWVMLKRWEHPLAPFLAGLATFMSSVLLCALFLWR